jgi:hypothetical protein
LLKTAFSAGVSVLHNARPHYYATLNNVSRTPAAVTVHGETLIKRVE